MTPCGFCDGPRLNGMALERDPDTGGWRPTTGSINPASPDEKFACRSCAKTKMNQSYAGQ